MARFGDCVCCTAIAFRFLDVIVAGRKSGRFTVIILVYIIILVDLFFVFYVVVVVVVVIVIVEVDEKVRTGVVMKDVLCDPLFEESNQKGR